MNIKHTPFLNFTLVLSLLSCSNANTNTNANTNKMASSVYNYIVTKNPTCNGTAFLVYYFDGDCAFCYAKILQIGVRHKEIGSKVVLIAKTQRPHQLLYSLKKDSIKYPLIIDSTRTTDNFDKYLPFNKITVVQKDTTCVFLDI